MVPAEVNISNYTATNVFLPTTDGIVKLGTTSFTDTPVFTVNNASLTFADNNADTGASPDTLKLGNIYGTAITGAFTDIGQTSVTLDATAPTTVTDKGAGMFEIGGLDASVLNAVTTHELIMNLPGTDTAADGITVTGSDVGVGGGNNLLQGTTGTLTHTVAAPFAGNAPAFIGAVGNDTITGGRHADNIFGMGGNDVITPQQRRGVGAATIARCGSISTTKHLRRRPHNLRASRHGHRRWRQTFRKRVR